MREVYETKIHHIPVRVLRGKRMKSFMRRTFLRKNPEKTQLKGSEKPMPYNIYGTKTYGEYYKKFNTTHYLFKYKFIVPLLMIGKKLLGRYLVKKPLPGHHNRNLVLFNEAYDETVSKWIKLFIRNTGPKEKRMNETQCEERIKNDQHLNFIKEFVNTIYTYDTAYREFVNILMHEITASMMNYYKDINDGKTGHLLHSVDLYEVKYFIMEKVITYHTEISVEESESLLRQAEQEFKEETKNV